MTISLIIIFFVCFLYSVYQGVKKKYFIGLLIISTYFSFLLATVGISHGKVLSVYVLYSLILFLFVLQNNRLAINSKNSILILFFTLFGIYYLACGYFLSPAVGYYYFNWKLSMYFTQVYLPSIFILIIGELKAGEIKFIKQFILSVTLILGLWLLMIFIPHYKDVISGIYFERYSLGEINTIWLARFMSIGFLIANSKEIYPEKGVKGLFIILFIFFTMILPGSKVILFFTIPIAIIYRFYQMDNSKGVRKHLIKTMVLVTMIFGAGFAVFTIFNQKAIMGRFSLESASIGFRLAGYELTIKKMLASGKYLFGNGPASLSQIVSFGYNTRWYPHNLILELFYEVGLMGIIIYFIPIFYAIRLNIKKKKTWIFFSLILFFLFAQTSGDLVANNFLPIYLSLYFVSYIKKEGT